MKKVVILSLDDLRHITMIKMYTDYFLKKGISFDIICMNRYNEEFVNYEGARVYSYHGTKVVDSKFKKLKNYLNYRKYAISTIKNNHYGYIVVWGERTAVVFSDFLRTHQPYCINIRDISIPKIPFIFNRFDNAVKYSDFSTWCAPKGLKNLPKHEYIIVLNQNKSLVEGAKKATAFINPGTPIRIGTIGYIRHKDSAKEIIDAFCNDERFVIQFFGTGSEELGEYAYSIGMRNIEIIGTFDADKTGELLDKIDVINAYCGDGKFNKKIAVGPPIRYGYSSLLYKPAIVSPNTYIASKTKKMNIAMIAKDFDTLPDRFYKWYHSLDFKDFKGKCDLLNSEYEKTVDRLYKVCDKKIEKSLLVGEI